MEATIRQAFALTGVELLTVMQQPAVGELIKKAAAACIAPKFSDRPPPVQFTSSDIAQWHISLDSMSVMQRSATTTSTVTSVSERTAIALRAHSLTLAWTISAPLGVKSPEHYTCMLPIDSTGPTFIHLSDTHQGWVIAATHKLLKDRPLS